MLETGGSSPTLVVIDGRKSADVTFPSVASSMRQSCSIRGSRDPDRQRDTVERSTPTKAAKSSSVIPVSFRNAERFMPALCRNGTSGARAFCATLAWDNSVTRRHNAFMDGRTNRLREWRRERKLTQEKLAELLGVNYTQIGKIERGAQGLREEHVWKLVDHYNCHPGELFEELPQPKYPPHVLELASIYARLSDEQRQFWLASGRVNIEQSQQAAVSASAE